MSEAAVKEEKKETKAEEKPEKKKKEKEVKKIHVKSQKANPMSPIDPRTGTRFQPGSARQAACDIIYNAAKEGKNVKEVREILANSRKQSGGEYNLDIGYLNFVVASHPEVFEVYSDGSIKILKEFKIDPEEAKKFEDERNAKKKKAEEEREKRKKEAAEGKKSSDEKSEKKEEKKEKKEHKPDEKPSKKG